MGNQCKVLRVGDMLWNRLTEVQQLWQGRFEQTAGGQERIQVGLKEVNYSSLLV